MYTTSFKEAVYSVQKYKQWSLLASVHILALPLSVWILFIVSLEKRTAGWAVYLGAEPKNK
jgi:hypothetical protein